MRRALSYLPLAVLAAGCGNEPTGTKATSGAAGTNQAAPSFSAYLTGGGPYKTGQKGEVTVVVDALGPYHVNQKYPYKFTLDAAPAGVTYPTTSITDVKREEKRATMGVAFTPSSAGEVTIAGTCSLSVCTDEECVMEKVPLSVTVKVDGS